MIGFVGCFVVGFVGWVCVDLWLVLVVDFEVGFVVVL